MAVWRRPLRWGLGQVFGPLPIDPAAGEGDPGLCGPGSASWRVIADTAAIVGGVRALLVQLLHPQAMAGVADHSEFRTDPLGRLRRTSAYVLATTFGSTGEAFSMTRRVRAVHRRVRGTGPDGRPYRADDPHLLAWVSLALTSSFLATDEAYGGQRLQRSEADAFVAEQSRIAALLDPRVDVDALAADPTAGERLRRGALTLPMLSEGRLPLSVDHLEQILDDFRPELQVGPQAREAIGFLLWPPLSPPVKAAYLPLLSGALATITPSWRALLGPRAALLGLPPAGMHARAVVATLRAVRGPSPVREGAEARATSRVV